MSSSSSSIQYRLLADSRELKAGNAVALYLRGITRLIEQPRNFGFETIDDNDGNGYVRIERWLELPLADLPVKDVRVYVGSFDEVLSDFRSAAYRSECNWEASDVSESILLGSPELPLLRRMGMVLALQARLEISQGLYVEATQTMMTSLSLSRHLAHGPTGMHVLTGISIANQTLDCIQELVQRTDAPNLYWALTAVADSFYDLQPALAGQKYFVTNLFPELSDLDTTTNSERTLLRLDKRARDLKDSYEVGGGDDLQELAVNRLYQQAQENLRDRGWQSETLDKMVEKHVVLVDMSHRQRIACQKYNRWFLVPFHQALPHLDDAYEELAENSVELDAVLTGGFLTQVDFPQDFARVWSAAVRLDRRIAALRVIESIRHYSATHRNKLPSALEKLRALPVPNDPITGKPFEFLSEKEGKATLRGMRPSGSSSKRMEMTWLLTIE